MRKIFIGNARIVEVTAVGVPSPRARDSFHLLLATIFGAFMCGGTGDGFTQRPCNG